jgi:hypothetical protein
MGLHEWLQAENALTNAANPNSMFGFSATWSIHPTPSAVCSIWLTCHSPFRPVPAVETLEKFARALEVPMYELFYDGDEPPKLPNLPKGKTFNDRAWGSTGKDARWLAKFRRMLARTKESDRTLLMYMVQKMAR